MLSLLYLVRVSIPVSLRSASIFSFVDEIIAIMEVLSKPSLFLQKGLDHGPAGVLFYDIC